MEPTGIIYTLFCIFVFTRSEPVGRHAQPDTLQNTRRILNGKEVGDTRPYMVYLRPTLQAEKQFSTSKWLCAGVIIHPRYILTSAACIEDVKNFYVIAGTNTWTPINQESACIKNGAKKAVWKCVSKDYYFDGGEFDNIRWMAGDIAVVKVEEDFNFKKRVRGCDYIPSMISFNNVSQDMEKSSTIGSVAGWGSINSYTDPLIGRTSENAEKLLEADVEIITKKNCKKRWESQYHNIIDKSMICTKDEDSSLMSAACLERGVDCKELEYSVEEDDKERRFRVVESRRALDPKDLKVHGAWHYHPNETRRYKVDTGGFCENDHGGPLIVGHGTTSTVIGIISACLTRDISKKCYGPYLYTSVWNYRHLISCAIDKDISSSETCRRAFGEEKPYKDQISEVNFEWKDHSDYTFGHEAESATLGLLL